MTAEAHILVRCDEESLAELVRGAERRLIVVAPCLSDSLAKVIVERWEALGPAHVWVSLDDDPAHIRAGLGTLTALQAVQKAATRLGAVVHRLPNAGITFVVSDNRSVALPADYFSPDLSPDKLNCLLVDQVLLRGSGPTPGSNGTIASGDSGSSQIDEEVVRQVAEDLKRNPPRPDPKREMLRAFKTEFEFVELELVGTRIEHKTARIRPELLGLADNEDLRQRMRASFRLIRPGDHSELSGHELMAYKNKIIDELLIRLAGYGWVVLHPNKEVLVNRVEELRKRVEAHKAKVQAELQAAIDRSRKELAAALFPSVKQQPPERWRKVAPTFDDPTVRRLLDEELQIAFGNAQDHIDEMKVNAIYKGVTAELMTDPDFLKVASRAIGGPTLFNGDQPT